MQVRSKLTSVILNDAKLYDVKRTNNFNIPEASVETIFETTLNEAGYGTVEEFYTKRYSRARSIDKFDSKTGTGQGAPDYIIYNGRNSEAQIIAIGDVKRPVDGGSDLGLSDAEYYIECFNEKVEHKIKIAFGYDGSDFKIKYLVDVEKRIWEDIFIDDAILTQIPSLDFMIFIYENGNYLTTDVKKNINKDKLEPFFGECDKILRRSKLSSSPVDKAIEVSIFIFIKVFSKKKLDKGFSKKYGYNAWQYVERGNIDAINDSFIKELNKVYKEVFPNNLISIESENAIELAKIINRMFDQYDLLDMGDIKGNAMEYFQKDSKDKKIGEFFTPRHLVKLVIYLCNPTIKFEIDNQTGQIKLDKQGKPLISHIDKCYDPACGSGGFLIEVLNWYLSSYAKYGILSEDLKDNIVFGTELKEKTVMLTKLNMILLNEGHQNIVRNSSISYVTTETIVKKKVDNKLVEVTEDKVVKKEKHTQFGTIYVYFHKDTNEPIFYSPEKCEYYLAKESKDGKKLVKMKLDGKYIKIEDKLNIESYLVDNNGTKAYRTKDTKQPVIEIKKDKKFFLGEYRYNKEGMPLKSYYNVEAVNEKVREQHGEYFGNFDMALSNHPYGLEEPSLADELFVTHMIDSVKNGGKIGCIVGENLLFDAKYSSFRDKLQQNYTIEAIISLPQGVFWPYTDVKTSILLIEKKKPHPYHKSWLVNVENDGFELTPSRNPIDKDDLQKLMNLWRTWGAEEYRSASGEIVLDSKHREEVGFAEFHKLNSINWCVKNYVNSISENKSSFKLEKIREILTRTKDQVVIEDEKMYKRITIQVNNRGIKLRDSVSGSKIGTKTQFTVKKGQFVISKIDARNGAYGIVPDDVDGAIITNNFWAFDINKDKILPEYLNYLMRANVFKEVCDVCSFGSTNRWYLNEDVFNDYSLPLPSKTEQRKILNLIEEQEKIIESASREIDNANEKIRNIVENLFS